MSVSGLVTEYLFQAMGILPTANPSLHGMVGRDVFGWNYTTVLDVIALAAFAVIYWLYRNRERFGAGAGYAKDPVCGMQVQISQAPATAIHNGTRHYFCSDHCQHRFTADPGRFTEALATPGGDEHHVDHDHAHHDHDHHQETVSVTETDPVCGMSVDPTRAAATVDHDGHTYYFCNPGCAATFTADPQRYEEQAAHP